MTVLNAIDDGGQLAAHPAVQAGAEDLSDFVCSHAWIGQQVQLQASFLAYMDAFWVLTLLALAAVPLALSLRNVKPGGGAPAGH
jgi:hypothetical protein